MQIRLFLAALLVAGMASPARGRQLSDTDLAAQAAACVRRYVHYSIFDDINVAVVHRSVTLTGWVTMPFKRDEIGARIAKIDGVDRIVNDIQVLPVSPFDADLRTRAARAIYGHPSLWHYASMANPPIHIIVARGRITLTGTVNSEVERALVFALAQVEGAFEVKNSLKLDRR